MVKRCSNNYVPTVNFECYYNNSLIHLSININRIEIFFFRYTTHEDFSNLRFLIFENFKFPGVNVFYLNGFFLECVIACLFFCSKLCLNFHTHAYVFLFVSELV